MHPYYVLYIDTMLLLKSEWDSRIVVVVVRATFTGFEPYLNLSRLLY